MKIKLKTIIFIQYYGSNSFKFNMKESVYFIDMEDVEIAIYIHNFKHLALHFLSYSKYHKSCNSFGIVIETMNKLEI